MSRGLGMMQRHLLAVIRRHGKPVTFSELRSLILKANNAPADAVLRSPVERSFRRALQGLVTLKALLALGSGGRADPHRYCVHPMLLAIAGNKEEFDAAMAALETDEAMRDGS